MPLSPGDKVDRYRIVASLGAGGMGEVYRAHDTRLQRDVALKILHPETAPGATPGSGRGSGSVGSALILREARSVAALEHPNIITIHDVGEIAEPEELRGTPYIAMELVKGRSLRQEMGPSRAPLAERISWLSAAALALGAAHKAGLVHRDVKPENIMIREDGTVKVLDFGIAKRSHASTAAVDPTSSTEAQLLPNLSNDQMVIGTPYYMAPEQMRSEPLDGRADQFSWGVVAYELLVGKPPWSREQGALTLVSEVLSKDPAPPSSVNPGIPAYVEAVIRRCLAKSPDARFPSMGDVVAALERTDQGGDHVFSEQSPFAHTEAIPSAPPGPRAPAAPTPAPEPDVRPPPAANRARWLRIGALGLTALIALFAVTTLGRRGKARPAGDSTDESLARDAGAPGFPEFGSPMSTVPEALDAYRSAMSSFRDANQDRALVALDGAIRADPSFAPAYLRYAVITGVPFGDVAREHLQEALRRRAALGPHDQLLLDAFAPVASAPGDLVETVRRLGAAAAGAPGDPDLQLQLCRGQLALGDYANAIATCTRASDLDPGSAAPLRVRAIAQLHANDLAGGLSSFDACLKVSPLATWCLDPLVQVRAFEGDCDAALTIARRLVSADRTSEAAYGWLAETLMGAGEPLVAVRTALAQKIERLRPADARTETIGDAALLAIATGAFESANERLAQWDKDVAESQEEEAHQLVTSTRVELAIEEGRMKDAKSLASAYLEKLPAWSSLDEGDRSIFYLGILYRIGAMSREDFTARRSKWLAWQKAQPSGNRYGSAAGFAWIAAYAEPARSAADAREALDALPGYLPLPDPLMRSPEFEWPIAKVYRLAGRDEEALPHLTRAAKSCATLTVPFPQMWASLALGEALEAAGNHDDACAAYAFVIHRWGAAPTSSTAKLAGARSRSMGCSR